jgi:glycosyltransferase involved in cell wall biosynthesis
LSARPLNFAGEVAIHRGMSSARVTCVVTTYQYGHFIGRCLDSVLGQDHPREQLEVIVVDDGSTDGTHEVVARYGDAVRYVHQPNAGQIAATNRGIAEATGDYITLVDADDTLPPDSVSARAEILDGRPEVGLVYGDMRIVDADDHLQDPSYHRSYDVPAHTGRVLGALLERNFVPGGTMMVRAADRAVYHPIAEPASVQDWWIAANVAAVAQLAYVDRPMANYRLHGANDSHGADELRNARLRANDLKFRRWMLGHLDLAAVALTDVLRGWFAYQSELATTSRALGEPLEQLAPVSVADAERGRLQLARGRIAREQGHIERAIRILVLAVAADPLSAAAREELHELIQGRLPPGEPLDVRGFVTLTVAEELLADESLLRAYASVFDGQDDATLLIYAPQAEPAIGAQLAELVSSAGLDGPGSPDMVAVFGPGDPCAHATVSRAVHATLSECSARVPGVGRWGSQAVEGLRQYAQACLRT